MDKRTARYIYVRPDWQVLLLTYTATNPIWVVKTRLQLADGDKKVLGGILACIKKIMMMVRVGFLNGLQCWEALVQQNLSQI